MSQNHIEDMLNRAFQGAHITVTPLADDNDHYAVEVSAECFRGKTRIQQHRMVYDALGQHSGTSIHALALTTRVPTVDTEK
jgi:stress-induced morphogen